MARRRTRGGRRHGDCHARIQLPHPGRRDGLDGAGVGGRAGRRCPRRRDPGSGLVELEISETDALAAGLACGGTATLLVRPAAEYPRELWDRLENREPVCLVTPVGAGEPAAVGATTLLTPATSAEAYAYADPVPRLFGRGTTAVACRRRSTHVAVAYWPVPTLSSWARG